MIKCGGVDFIRIPMEYSMQCKSCWTLAAGLANPYKFKAEMSDEKIIYPEFELVYTGVLKAAADYKRYGGDGFIRIHQYEYVVDFIPSDKKENSVRCAHADTSLIEVNPANIRELIKEAWDWERGEEAGMKRALFDYLSSPTLRVFTFQGLKRREI